MTAKITAKFADGTVVTRKTDADYIAASRDRSGKVRFHATVSAANRVPNAEVVAVEDAPASGGCVVCGGTRKVPSRSAVTGAVSYFPCHRCS